MHAHIDTILHESAASPTTKSIFEKKADLTHRRGIETDNTEALIYAWHFALEDG